MTTNKLGLKFSSATIIAASLVTFYLAAAQNPFFYSITTVIVSLLLTILLVIHILNQYHINKKAIQRAAEKANAAINLEVMNSMMSNNRPDQQLYNKVLDAINTMETSNELFTDALIALEAHDYEKAKFCATYALELSDSIEQRIALQFIISITEKHDDEYTDNIIRISYDV